MLQGLKRWLGYETKVLVSPLPQTVCVERLRTLTQNDWMLFGSSPLMGRVRQTDLKVRKRPPLLMHNSFQTYLRGTLESDGTRTRLICRFGLHRFVAGFMLVWFGMLWVFASVGVIAWLKHPAEFKFLAIGLAGPAIMTLFGAGLVSFCRYLARDEQQFVLNLLRQTLDASEASAPASPRIEPVVKR